MSTPATVPMFDPQGNLGDIPYEQMHAAVQAGGKIGVNMTDPQGNPGVVPADQMHEAIKAGGKIVPYSSGPEQSWWDITKNAVKSAASDVGNALLPNPNPEGNAIPGMGMMNAIQSSAQTMQNSANRGHGTAYQLGAGVAAGAGANVGGMEQAAEQGNVGGVIGHAAAVPATYAAGRSVPAGLRALGGVVKNQVEALNAMRGGPAAESAAEARIAGPIKATMADKVPDIASQPNKAVAGTDQVLQAASPTKTQTAARANYHTAAGDLASVYDKVDWEGTKGGKALTKGGAAPDMRVRAVTNAVNDRMQEMYQTEVAPKMNGLNGVPAQIADNPEAYNFLGQTAGDSTVRTLAQRAADSPESITVPEAYQLSKAVNAELNKFEAMDPAQQYQAKTTNPGINHLDGLDEQLNQTISQALKDRGLPGIDNFNRRYAAMAEVRKDIAGRMNEVEMRRQGAGQLIKQAVGIARGPRHAIASASAAANADLNVGQMLQDGLKRIKDSGIRPALDPTPPAPTLGLRSPGQMPPAQQRPLPFMNSPNPSRAGTIYPQGAGAGGPSFAGEGQPSFFNVTAKSSAPKSPSKAGGGGGSFKMPSPADDLALAVRQAQKAGTRKDYFVNQLTRYMYPGNAAKVTPAQAAQAWDAALQK